MQQQPAAHSMVQPPVPHPHTAMAAGTGQAWSPPSPMPTPAPIKAPPRAQSRRSANSALLLGVGAVAVLGIGGFFLFSGDSKKKKKSSNDDDDDDKKSTKGEKKEDPEKQRAADCEKLAAFKTKSEKDVDAHNDPNKTPTADDMDALAKTLDSLSVECKNLDVKTPEAKSITARYSTSLATAASAARGVASAMRTNDVGKAQTEAAKFEKLEPEVEAIEADSLKLCPNLDSGGDGS
jgi:hypothetical protein